MDVRFLAPEFLLLLFLVPVAWFVPRRLTDIGHGLLRSAVIALLALGLARPTSQRDETRPRFAVVVDRSPSVEPASRAAADDLARSLVRTLAREGTTSLIEVGPRSATDVPGSPAAQVLGRDGTSSPLAGALASAARAVPVGAPGAIVLLSDGLATGDPGPDWGPITQDLTARGIPIHTFDLSAVEDVYPVSIEALETLRVGHTARLVVEIVGDAQELDVVLSGPSGEIERRAGGACSGRAAYTFEFEPEEAGFVTFAVESIVAHGANPIASNDRLERTFAVQDPLRVLYLGGRAAGGAGRLGELLGAGFALDGGAAPTDATADLGTRLSANYDLVVFDDQAADAVPEAFQRDVARAVTEEGLGIFMSGGTGSFGPGGWHETPLADVLPVEFQQKEEKRDPSTTLVVIIDTSGSMGGNRVQLAKEVSRLAIRRLLPHDKVGIVEFYGAKHWAAPIQPASNSIELERALNRLDAGGGTVILPAIEEAFYALQNVQTRHKHVLVLTDGGVETGAFETLLRRMAQKGINVSTVLIGPEAHSEFLVTLANWGKGRFYTVPNRFNLPEILLKQPTSAKLPAYRPGTHSVQARGGAGWWGATDARSVPAIAGYVETKARSGAEVLLETTEGAHPVLATWQPGLGRVSALTTEPTGPGTEPWSDWEDYGSWLARVLARTAADTREPYAFDVRRAGPQVVLSAARRRTDAGPPWARVLEGESKGPPLAFRQRAEGLFEARLYVEPANEVRFACGAEEASAVTRVVLNAPGTARELQVDPASRLDLERLADATAGTFHTALPDAPPQLAAGGGTAPVGLSEWRPWLLFLALALYLLELFYRRRDGRRRIA